jgi:hypothetical protein
MVLIGQCAALAQTKPVAKKEPQNKHEQKQPAAPVTAAVRARAEAPKPSPPKFRLNMIEGERLDHTFHEMPLEDLINAVQKNISVRKGEFESTSEFSTRKATALAMKFLGDYGMDDTFAVVSRVYSIQTFPMSYAFNPDTSEVSVFVLPRMKTMDSYGEPNGLYFFDFDTKIESERTYQARNAYGAVSTVQESIMSTKGIAASPVSVLTFGRRINYNSPSPTLRFKMDNSRAAKELGSLKALLVFKLEAPYMDFDYVHKEPTRESPRDVHGRSSYIICNLQGIIYYSGLTGEIFARLPESFGRPQLLPAADAASTSTDAKKY